MNTYVLLGFVGLFVVIAILIERLLTYRQAISNLHRKKKYDDTLAKQVHQSIFLPPPKETRFLDIGNKVVFTKELGGDYYYLANIEDTLFYCMADISGKSIVSSLFSTLLHQTVTDCLEEYDSLETILQTVNSRMYQVLPEDMFVTMFVCSIDENELSYINAGHEPPLLFSKQEKKVKFLNSSQSMPLGLHPFLEPEPRSESFDSSCIFLAVTDGVTESDLFIDNPFNKLEVLLRQSAEESAQEIVDKIYRMAAAENQNFPLDDLIITCIKRKLKL